MSVNAFGNDFSNVRSSEYTMKDLERYGLPQKLKERLIRDANSGGSHYQRIPGVECLETRPPNSGYWGTNCFTCCRATTLVQTGNVGLLRDGAEDEFLAPGYHAYACCGIQLDKSEPVTKMNQVVQHGTRGFVTITEGRIGVLTVGGEYRLLPPGTYQWNSPSVCYVKTVAITVNAAQLGPYALITVPDGEVATTFNNGRLVILGHDVSVTPTPAVNQPAPMAREVSDLLDDSDCEPVRGKGAAGFPPVSKSKPPTATASVNPGNKGPGAKLTSTSPSAAGTRTFFLDDPKWVLANFLSLKEQTDRLEGNDLLSKDNVELLMVAWSHWRIVDPYLAVYECGTTMDEIRAKVDALVRAAIARIVAGTNIGSGPVSGGLSKPMVVAQVASGANNEPSSPDNTLSHLMQSDQATRHMAELGAHLGALGVEVLGIYVPEKRMKNDDIRQEIAKQAVIGIKAEAERSAADAQAYATIAAAKAQAEAIAQLAKAHAEAGERLGDPNSTAARLALSEQTTKSLTGAKLTVFSGNPSQFPYMFTQPMS